MGATEFQRDIMRCITKDIDNHWTAANCDASALIDLKTPPDTPSVLAQFGNPNYHDNLFSHSKRSLKDEKGRYPPP
ncbi:hypothetical protein F5Y00DRAFT_261862 [Daldinia vernicosa]|uniref:uncharacterized protein n=1 Tax=Daldinia vernicosa TaxID=114800 RepID=UPI002008BE35|nr:uncharacterized protein F5Y00DRAFT_261862 [Daldinia vernicosa]KAI0849049.1 hypothetical protein F5Y00DRAFT_261862 [Daldinia vernicosa]